MTQHILHRIDPARNMARFYLLSLQPTLFGEVSVARNWGRIGTGGRCLVEFHTSEGAARAALERLEASKRRRGYRNVE
ncbi:WGR domain-containing protein [Mesorhizobium sp. PUT5]|uniref:WGR domain-containing protein n=1 Tax=Mesorhizobium sp. PUT5 TaxID=3454629 RepID=UPI003FA4AB38